MGPCGQDRMTDQPQCKHCGSQNVVSHGESRLCRDCGRKSRKQYLGPALPDYSKRPPCPKCGAYRAKIHDGTRYLCGHCGTCFPRNWQEQEQMLSYEADTLSVASQS